MSDKIRISNGVANVDIWADKNTTISLVDYEDDEYAEINTLDLSSILLNSTQWNISKNNEMVKKLEEENRELRFEIREKDSEIKTLKDTIQIKEKV